MNAKPAFDITMKLLKSQFSPVYRAVADGLIYVHFEIWTAGDTRSQRAEVASLGTVNHMHHA